MLISKAVFKEWSKIIDEKQSDQDAALQAHLDDTSETAHDQYATEVAVLDKPPPCIAVLSLIVTFVRSRGPVPT